MSDILIQNVCKTFSTKEGEVQALKNVNLIHRDPEISYGIIGMSGAGKSTLVRCMNFLEVPTDRQEYWYDGQSLGRPDTERAAEAAGGDRNDLPAFQPADAEKCSGKRMLSIIHSGKIKRNRKQEREHWSFWRS